MHLIKRILLTTVLAVLVFVLLLQAWFAVHILAYRHTHPDSTAFMRQRLALARETKPQANFHYHWVEEEAISRHLKRALIAAEDSAFVDHEGFDWDGIERALEKNREKGRHVAGGSTITQQLAKNLFLSPSKTYVRKGQEALITLMLETFLDKERILTLYLNVIEWGDGIYGAEAAAQHYFKQSARQLSVAQAAKLAAMVPNPRFYQKNLQAPGLARKTQIIIRRMGQVELP
ncbi:MAG: monofunctional biosynthetic peptidoglycan transglycosylase [Pseudomonadota bacterium]|jgi:monofunctional biosynthetic peptidoglycan transglycosylase